MKLRINKACDLSSISVLPPRRSGGMMSSRAEGLGRNQQQPQIRSLSQQSFSQGSFSQLSQSSLDENLMNDQQRFSSQEKDNSSKRISSLAQITSAHDESQLQLSKPSNNILRRWNASTSSDSRYRPNEELELKIRLMESSLNRIGMILDSVQGDILQVNRAVKEVALEADGIRQKINLLENSVQQMVKWEDNVKTSLDGSLRSISDQLISNSNFSKINEIATTLRSLQWQIESRLGKLEHELRAAFTKQKEVIPSHIKPYNSEHMLDIISPFKRSLTDGKLQMKGQIPEIEFHVPSSTNGNKQISTFVKSKDGKSSTIKQLLFNKEVVPRGKQEQCFRIILDSDEDANENDDSYHIVKQERGKKSHIDEEVHQETLRILKKARKRRRHESENLGRRALFLCC